ncbi:MAG: hypothetical protein KAQ68_07855 [Clostridiales bacterium]|nr:hypothetical protein [Clostridiales bacterium]
MDEAIFKGYQIWDKIRAGDFKAFNFSDIIWLLGIAVIVVLIIKVSFKFLKVILVVLAIAAVIGFLIMKGIIPI